MSRSFPLISASNNTDALPAEKSDQSSKRWHLIAIVLAGVVASALGISGSIGLSYIFHSIQLPPSWFTATIDFIGNTPHFWSLWVIAIGGCALGLLAGLGFYKVYRDEPKGKMHSMEPSSEPTKTQELEKQINELRKELEAEEARRLCIEKTITHYGKNIAEKERIVSNHPSFINAKKEALTADSNYELIDPDHLAQNDQGTDEQRQALIKSLKAQKKVLEEQEKIVPNFMLFKLIYEKEQKYQEECKSRIEKIKRSIEALEATKSPDIHKRTTGEGQSSAILTTPQPADLPANQPPQQQPVRKMTKTQELEKKMQDLREKLDVLEAKFTSDEKEMTRLQDCISDKITLVLGHSSVMDANTAMFAAYDVFDKLDPDRLLYKNKGTPEQKNALQNYLNAQQKDDEEIEKLVPELSALRGQFEVLEKSQKENRRDLEATKRSIEGLKVALSLEHHKTWTTGPSAYKHS